VGGKDYDTMYAIKWPQGSDYQQTDYNTVCFYKNLDDAMAHDTGDFIVVVNADDIDDDDLDRHPESDDDNDIICIWHTTITPDNFDKIITK
jgi:hypothetical protein